MSWQRPVAVRLEAARRLVAQIIPEFRWVRVEVVPRHYSERTAAGPGGATGGPTGLEVAVIPEDPERGDLMASVTVFPFDGTINGVALDIPTSGWVSVPDIWSAAERLPGQLWSVCRVSRFQAEVRTFNLAPEWVKWFEEVWRLAIDDALAAAGED